MSSNRAIEEFKVPLLEDLASVNQPSNSQGHHDDHQQPPDHDDNYDHIGEDYDHQQSMGQRVVIESKKLWHIVGPSIFSRVTSFSIFVITQAFAGHLGDVELAAISIGTNIIIGFSSGLLVNSQHSWACTCNVHGLFYSHVAFWFSLSPSMPRRS